MAATMGDGVLRLAMWSGPRNVSTAFMRSWGNREDTLVVDEPFYAHYLKVTGLEHPGRDEIIATHEADWRRVAASLVAPMPAHVRIFYQKQMSHHLLPHMGREWLDSVTHAFLIRDPVGDAGLARREAGGVRPACHGFAAAGRDFRARGRTHRPSAARAGFSRPAAAPRTDAAGALRRARGAILQSHAVMARRAARYGRRLGQALVRPGRTVDGIRDAVVAVVARALARRWRRWHRQSPRSKPSAARCTKNCAHIACAPEVLPCCRNSTNATAT